MAAIRFYGASDDLIEVEGSIPGCDEYNGESGRFEVAGLVVEVTYESGGVWGVSVAQIDEDVPVTASDLRLSVTQRHDGAQGYSMALDMEVPAGSYVTPTNLEDA